MPPDTYFFIASIFFTLALAAFFASKGFSINEFSLFGQKLKFENPFQFASRKRFLIVSLGFILCAATAAALGLREKIDPSSERALRYSDLYKAEIQASNVDDMIIARVNGKNILQAEYGEAPDWVEITDMLHRGANAVEAIVQNGRYGGCGARLRVRLNGIVHADHDWRWGAANGDKGLVTPYVVCFQEVNTVNLR